MTNKKLEIADIEKELSKVMHSEVKQNIVSLGMVKTIEVDDTQAVIILKTPNEDKRVQIGIEAQVRQLVSKLYPGKIYIKFEIDSSMKLETGTKLSGVKKILTIGSGKGGVGKSTVTVNLAAALTNMGYKVGILDADIYGPSIGKMFGINGRVTLKTDEHRIFPMEKFGIKLISFSFLLEENQPVVWRGPMLGKALEQFLFDIEWGELDFLLIDLPPGTGDVQLSLAQLVDVNGAIIVTTPQSVALLDARKAAAMFNQVQIPILGIVENMNEFICPHCQKPSSIFSSGGGDKMALESSTKMLGGIPLTIDIMESGEAGTPIAMKDKNGIVAKAYETIANNMKEELAKWD